MTHPSSDAAAVANPVAALKQFGQSVWLDFIRRSLIAGGELKRLVDEDGLGGVTSNPAIFEKAINGSSDYDNEIRALGKQGKNSTDIYEALAIDDVGRATCFHNSRASASVPFVSFARSGDTSRLT